MKSNARRLSLFLHNKLLTFKDWPMGFGLLLLRCIDAPILP
jgi:hypothetical protein